MMARGPPPARSSGESSAGGVRGVVSAGAVSRRAASDLGQRRGVTTASRSAASRRRPWPGTRSVRVAAPAAFQEVGLVTVFIVSVKGAAKLIHPGLHGWVGRRAADAVRPTER